MLNSETPENSEMDRDCEKESWTFRSPAKLNLFLEVVRRREDGFHELDTLMVPVSLFDRLTISRRNDERITLRCLGNDAVPCDGRNLIVKAIEAYRKCKEVPSQGALPRRCQEIAPVDRLRERAMAGFEVVLEKRIPMEAGLGGGSGNAAATLMAIHRIYGEPTLSEPLEKLGAKLGCDVPFFFSGAAARCRGRGEILEPIPDPPKPFYFVLVRPPEGFATATAYRYCRTAQDCGDQNTIEPILAAWNSGDPERLGRTCYNRLEAAVFPHSTAVRETIELLRRERTYGVGMSGSGTCCFAVCRDQAESERLAERIREQLVVRSEERIGQRCEESEPNTDSMGGWFVCSVGTMEMEKSEKAKKQGEWDGETLE